MCGLAANLALSKTDLWINLIYQALI
jgi:hypothetical protein